MYQEKEMSFLEHLEELRWHIIRSTFGIVIAATIAFLCKSFLFDDLILGPTKSNFFTYKFPKFVKYIWKCNYKTECYRGPNVS